MLQSALLANRQIAHLVKDLFEFFVEKIDYFLHSSFVAKFESDNKEASDCVIKMQNMKANMLLLLLCSIK